MKKLLTIMVLALALCLVCGVALAANVQLTGDAYTDATQAILTNGTISPITVTYKGESVDLYWTNSTPAMKCLEKRTLHYEGWCGYWGDNIFFEFIYTKPHDYVVGSGTKIEERTCTTNAKLSTVCTTCGAKVEYTYPDSGADATLKKTGHSWEHGDNGTQVITTAPTCEAAGVWEYYCSYGCGTKNPNKKAQVIEEVGHDFVLSWVKAPTCISKGTVTYNCRHCGVEWNAFLNSGSAAASKITAWRKNEVKSILDKQYTVADALNETSIIWKDSWSNLTAKYQWSNVTSPDYYGHDFDAFVPYKAATCGTNSQWIRWCPVCGEKQELDNWFVKGFADNTWNSPKYVMTEKVRWNNSCYQVRLTFKCSLCDSKIHPELRVYMTDKQRIDLTTNGQPYAPADATEWGWIGIDPKEVASVDAHEYKISNTYKIGTFAPTCELKGYTAYMCIHDGVNAPADYIINADGTITIPADGHPVKKVDIKDALGHDWGDGWEMQYAPEEYDNVNGYWLRTCKRCGKTENRISPYYPDACETHTFKVASEKAATCTEDGEKVEKCSVCGFEKVTVLKAAGHKLDTLVKTNKAATCTEKGEGLFMCSVCEQNFTDEIPALGHKWDAGKVTKEATKDAKGEKTFTCTVCGETKKEDVEWKPAEPAKYAMTATYDGKSVKGKLVHDDLTVEAPSKNIRVTFYVEGNYYMATMAEVDADGSFSVDGVGPIKYITVAATGNSSVNPEDYAAIADPFEIFVK